MLISDEHIIRKEAKKAQTLMKKKESRLRRAKRARGQINLLGVNRLCVFRTPRHIYAQVIAPGSAQVLASASTLDKEIRSKLKNGGNVEAALAMASRIEERHNQASAGGSNGVGEIRQPAH